MKTSKNEYEIPWDVLDAIDGLLEICRQALPDSYWATDNRVNAVRELLGDQFPSDDDLFDKVEARLG